MADEKYDDRTNSTQGPNDPLLLACRRVAAAMDLFDEAACRVLGVGRSDLRALNLLEHGPLHPTQIGQALGLRRASITGLLDRLESAGYISRHPDPDDRRAVLVQLEPATWRAFAQVYRPLGERIRTTASGLPTAERRAVAHALQLMAGAFDDARAAL